MTFDQGPKFGRFKNGAEKKTNPHTAFRQSKAWKDFRLFMIASVENQCELCGYKYPGALLQVHHLDPGNYTILNPAQFSVLCASDHDLIERFVNRINGRHFIAPCTIIEWNALIGKHLSNPARQKWEEIIAGIDKKQIKKLKS